MRRPLIFVGSRQTMLELACIAELNDIEVVGILDHHYLTEGNVSGIPVIGDERWLLDQDNIMAQHWLKTCDFFPANWHNGEMRRPGKLSIPDLRLERIRILEESGANVINLIHPDSSIRGIGSKYSSYAIGKGVLIHAKVYHGVDKISIGDYCAFMNGNTTVHDVHLGKNVLVAPDTHLVNCTIGDNSYIGMRSFMNPFKRKGLITVGENVTIWVGSDVKKDVPDNSFHTSEGRIMKKYLGDKTS